MPSAKARSRAKAKAKDKPDAVGLKLSIPSKKGSHQNGYSCLSRTSRSSRTLTTTSRPYETVIQPSLSPQPKYRFDTSVPNRLLEQNRISILKWNLEPRRGRPGAIEEHVAGKWHIVALQEAIEYLQHECLVNHFYITHFAGCVVF